MGRRKSEATPAARTSSSTTRSTPPRAARKRLAEDSGVKQGSRSHFYLRTQKLFDNLCLRLRWPGSGSSRGGLGFRLGERWRSVGELLQRAVGTIRRWRRMHKEKEQKRLEEIANAIESSARAPQMLPWRSVHQEETSKDHTEAGVRIASSTEPPRVGVMALSQNNVGVDPSLSPQIQEATELMNCKNMFCFE
ncbi:hypothetical protein EJB05_18473, partial [Eragrostis curvula]